MIIERKSLQAVVDRDKELHGMTTPESKAAKLLGRKGGRSKSPEKQAAARENGKLGGRPHELVRAICEGDKAKLTAIIAELTKP